jgi:hypothetical protein
MRQTDVRRIRAPDNLASSCGPFRPAVAVPLRSQSPRTSPNPRETAPVVPSVSWPFAPIRGNPRTCVIFGAPGSGWLCGCRFRWSAVVLRSEIMGHPQPSDGDLNVAASAVVPCGPPWGQRPKHDSLLPPLPDVAHRRDSSGYLLCLYRPVGFDGGTHTFRCRLRVLVLPDPDHLPTCCGQQRVYTLVSLSVAIELRTPIPAICLRRLPMLRTAVPEAAIDKHRDLPGWEHDVCAVSNASDWTPVLEEPQAEPVERRPQCHLRSGVRAAVTLHHRANTRRARRGRTRQRRQSADLRCHHHDLVICIAR